VTPMKAIRLKCLDCSAGSAKEVRQCPVKDCSLWPYRLGKRPETVARHERQKTAAKLAISGGGGGQPGKQSPQALHREIAS